MNKRTVLQRLGIVVLTALMVAGTVSGCGKAEETPKESAEIETEALGNEIQDAETDPETGEEEIIVGYYARSLDNNDDSQVAKVEEASGTFIEEAVEEAQEIRDNSAKLGTINVEEEVLNIRTIYNSLVDDQSKGRLTEEKHGDNILYRYSDGDIAILTIPKGTYGSQYKRLYYFKDRELLFAYIEGSDSHRLYFKDGYLFRWRYCPNANDTSDYVDHDLDNSDEFYGWEDFCYKDIENARF